ncbi:cation transporter [Priestia megaterium]|nr:cation transporter [Priestia megaterium]
MSDSHHHHHHITDKNKKLFIWAFSLTIFFALLEIVYGFISGSLMVIGDGIHMGSDSISLFLGLLATFMVTKAATSRRTFGYNRFEPIAAFVNGLTLILIPLYIIYEAIMRIINPVDINASQMLIVGAIGLFINGLVGFILSKGESNINMRSAMLHVVADMITSLSAVIVALSIMFFDTLWLDPIGSLVTSVIIIRGGLAITKEAFGILMEGTPDHLSADDVRNVVKKHVEGASILDIKLWCTNEEHVYLILRLSASATSSTIELSSIKDDLHRTLSILPENIFIENQTLVNTEKKPN